MEGGKDCTVTLLFTVITLLFIVVTLLFTVIQQADD